VSELVYSVVNKNKGVISGGKRRLFSFVRISFVQIPNYSQQDATFPDLFTVTDAVHVSGGSSAHHQEHTTVHTDSSIVNQYCC